MLPSDDITANTATVETSPTVDRTPSAAELAREVAWLKQTVFEITQALSSVSRLQLEQRGAIDDVAGIQAAQAKALKACTDTFRKLHEQVVAVAKQREMEMERAKAAAQEPDSQAPPKKEKVN